MTDSATYIKQANDCGNLGNNAAQTNGLYRPIDNGSNWNFTLSNLAASNSNSLYIPNTLTMYSVISGTAIPNVACIGVQNWNGLQSAGYTGWGNALVSNKVETFINFNKTYTYMSGTTTVNDGATHKIATTVNCTKKWSNYGTTVCGGETPFAFLLSSTYYLFMDSAGSSYSLSANNPYFINATRQLLLANYVYPTLLIHGNTYYLCVTDPTIDTVVYFKSNSLLSGYVRQGTIANAGSLGLTQCDFGHMVFVQDSFKTYFEAWTSAGAASTIRYASSKTAVNGTWAVHGTVIPNGSSGTFDNNVCADPYVYTLSDSTLIMFYSGYNNTYAMQSQGYATSNDGISWTKFSGNPIHDFSGQTYEAGIYGSNEPSMIYEPNGGAGGLGIWRMYYRANNLTAPYLIGYSEYFANPNDAHKLPLCGNETITTNIYVDGNLDATYSISGALGIDFMPKPTQPTYVGGNGVNFLRYTGKMFDVRIYKGIKNNF